VRPVPDNHCGALCCAVGCCAVLCCAVGCCAVLCCAMLCCGVVWRQAVVCSPESLDLAMVPAGGAPGDPVVVILARRLSSLLDSPVLITSPKCRLLQVSQTVHTNSVILMVLFL